MLLMAPFENAFGNAIEEAIENAIDDATRYLGKPPSDEILLLLIERPHIWAAQMISFRKNVEFQILTYNVHESIRPYLRNLLWDSDSLLQMKKKIFELCNGGIFYVYLENYKKKAKT